MKNVFVFVLDNCQWPLRERFGLFIYLSLQLQASGELKQFITKLTFIALQLRALGNSAVFCWWVQAYKDALCFWVLFLLWAENFFGGWHSECTVNRSNKHFHTEPCLCLLHHNNSPLSYSRSFGVSCRFNGLMHWAGQKQCFIVSGQNTTHQESKSI